MAGSGAHRTKLNRPPISHFFCDVVLNNRESAIPQKANLLLLFDCNPLVDATPIIVMLV